MASSLGLAAALVGMLAAGLWIGGHPAKMPPVLREVFVDSSAGLAAEATELIEDNYYRPVSEGDLINSSLRGMVRNLRRTHHDRFSEYFSPSMLERFNEEISGRFSGVGIEISPVKRGFRAARVFPGSPAAKAGIVAGDVIVSADGHPIAGESVGRARTRIVGPEGTKVTLGVVRPPSRRVRKITVTRAEIRPPDTLTRVIHVRGHTLGYVRYGSFTEDSSGELRRAVRRVEKKGAQGIVLDLRGNGGGFLDEAVADAGIFLPEGEVVVSTNSRTQGHAVYKTHGDSLPSVPLVVLIDRNTASAAEILTAALADDAGAKVVGTRSYGKGVFQQEVDLSNGGALKLTIGEYFTPAGKNLAGTGIHPDVRARDLPGTPQDEALQRALGVLGAEQALE
ncbi:MAG: S41 family peptidase [Solirubrobacterales bacterium]